MTLPPWRLWSTPVPLRSANFVALHEEHRACNVVTSSLGPFIGGRTADTPVAYCDFQTEPNSALLGRLGSGRAGRLGDRYLKGIGLTPLAANWTLDHDRYHGSGHLAASSAAREYLVSKWIAKRGLGSLVVPCEGLLVAPLDPSLAEFDQALAPNLAPRMPADLALQAISVKPASFSRWANFLWLFDRLPITHQGRLTSPAMGVRMLAEALVPSADVAGSSPDDVVGRVRTAVERSLANFEAFFAHGISWMSVFGNFAIDGRFLDLELPLVIGAPVLGAYDARTTVGQYAVVGCDWLLAARYLRRCVRSFGARLRRVAEDLEYRGAVADFYAAVTRGLYELLADPDSPIGTDEAMTRGFVAMVDRVRPLSPGGRDIVVTVASAVLRDDPGAAVAGQELEPTALKDVSIEPGVRGDLVTHAKVFVHRVDPAPDVAAFWKAIDAADRATTVDAYLASVRDGGAAI